MAINLGNGLNGNPPQSGAAPVLNLQKNDLLDLTKREPGLTHVLLGAGWDVAQNGQDFDLDVSVFMLDQQGKFNTVDNIIFYNNKTAPGITLNGDNRTGAGEGDDETISLDLAMIKPDIQRLVFMVTINDAVQRHQTFGMVRNAYVRLLNVAKQNQEICRFNLQEQGSTATAVIFAELQRQGAEWNFKAIGEGKVADLNGLLALYM